jgi:hypothetical protein
MQGRIRSYCNAKDAVCQGKGQWVKAQWSAKTQQAMRAAHVYNVEAVNDAGPYFARISASRLLH